MKAHRQRKSSKSANKRGGKKALAQPTGDRWMRAVRAATLLVAGGKFERAAAESGVSARTLRLWRSQAWWGAVEAAAWGEARDELATLALDALRRGMAGEPKLAWAVLQRVRAVEFGPLPRDVRVEAKGFRVVLLDDEDA